MKNALRFALLISISVFGCECDDGTTGVDDNGNNTGGDTGNNNGGDTGNNTGDDSGNNDDDGGNPGGDGGDEDGGGGDSGMQDTGTAIDEPLSEFCTGMGTVVQIGDPMGGLCAGEVATQAFQFAICACNDVIDAQSNVYVDSFDSSLGTYGSTVAGGGVNIGEDGNIGVNHMLVNFDAQLQQYGSTFIGGGGFGVRGSSMISGNVVAAGSSTGAPANTIIGRNMFVDGNVTGRYHVLGDLHVPATATVTQTTVDGDLIRGPIRNRLPCACGADEILDVPAITAYGRMHNDNDENMAVTSTAWENGTGPSDIRLPCGRYYITSINQGGPIRIIAEGRTVLFIDGDLTAGSLSLELEPGAEMDVFIAGDIGLQSASDFGQAEQPAAVRTYVGGTGAIDLSANAFFGGNLYAPRADVYFGASADLFGALVARNIYFNGSADIHFDSAIRQAGDTCEEPPVDTDAGVTDGATMDAGGADAGDGGPDDVGPRDSGTPACTDCSECSAPSGCRQDGTCGACEVDSDCCAPLVCIAGACMLQI